MKSFPHLTNAYAVCVGGRSSAPGEHSKEQNKDDVIPGSACIPVDRDWCQH